APGSRHPKRFQDVEELLDAGMNVYTTVNIEDLESLNHVVAQITGLKVQETIPDRILDRADEIELIDLSPEELLRWLREGKVYVPEEAERAVRKYFLPSDLIASCDLAPRETADHGADQQQPALRAPPGEGHQTVTARTTVAVSGEPLAEQLGEGAVVNAGRRVAEEFGGDAGAREGGEARVGHPHRPGSWGSLRPSVAPQRAHA